MTDSESADAAAVIAALADPWRRALYEQLRRSDQSLGRDELADLTGLPRATAAFHLDRLVEVGALTAAFVRRSGRTGPGAGRPAKFYSVASDEVSVSVPPRHYEIVGDILASAAEESDRTGLPIRECVVAVAEASGRHLGDPDVPLEHVLGELGYAPEQDAEGGYRLTNCPFHRLASRHTDLICSTNAAFLRGISGESSEFRQAWLEPTAGNCCVRIGAPETAK